MKAELTITFRPNNADLDRYTVRIDNGKPWEDNPPIVGTDDPGRCADAVAAFLVECEVGEK